MWLRDLPLTAEQEAALDQRVNARIAHYTQQRGGYANAHKGRELRRKYQEEGRIKARENDPLHLGGCMLYWAEGNKDRNILVMINSDADMLKLFVRFLKDCFHVTNDQIKLRIIFYNGNGLEAHEIQDFWLKALNLPDNPSLQTRH